MAWLHHIPSMISALAFGYGIGMAAPDTALDGVRGTVAGTNAQSPRVVTGPTAPAHQWADRGPLAAERAARRGRAPAGRRRGPDAAAMLPGRESSRLAALREQPRDDAGSCRLDQRVQSRPPSYRSGDGGYDDDVDDISSAGREALSRLQLPDFRVPISRQAIKYVRFLTRTNRGRDMFETWLRRSGRYQDLVQQTLREWHLPEDLIWVAMIESGFDPRATSPAGAVGLWQFMRSTGKVYGLRSNRFIDDRRNPVTATRAAAHHLRDLHQRFGAWDLALAAYNMGYEQLLTRIDRVGTTDFSELARQRALPAETASYVPKIVAAALVANNLDRYGFDDVRTFKPLHHAELSVPGGTLLRTLAKAAGVSTSLIRKYNPQFRTGRVPPGADEVVLVPAETLSRARAALPAMMSDSRLAMGEDQILAPRDLFGLSGVGKHRRDRDAWSQDENLLGMLPKPKRRSLRSMLGHRAGAGEPAAADLAAELEPRRVDRETVMYRVGSGDTLIGVARQFAVDIDDLAADNNLGSNAKLREGALLKLSVKRSVLRRWKELGNRPRRAASAKRSKPAERATADAG